MQNNSGFTIIELMLVVGIVSILSGVTLGVINIQKQKEYAGEAVIKENLSKLATALEGFYNAEGFYPVSTSAAGVSNYIKTWPGTNYTYYYDAASKEFSITAYDSNSPTKDELLKVLKYSSVWKTINECDEDTPPDEVDACLPIEEK